VLQLCAKVF